MVAHMKTTIDISDALLRAAKRNARVRGLTLRALVEEGLRRVLREDAAPRPFRLRRASFGGQGRAADAREWNAVRELIYPGRGG